MKIHHDVTHSLQQADKSTPSKGASTGFVRPASQTDSPSTVDSVSLSPTSRSLANVVGGTEAPFDAKRVEAIKSAISSGQFKIDPSKIADKVIDSANQLLGS